MKRKKYYTKYKITKSASDFGKHKSRKEEKEMTDCKRDEILIKMDVTLEELKKDFENHLKTHAKYTYLALTTALGMIISLILVLMNK